MKEPESPAYLIQQDYVSHHNEDWIQDAILLDCPTYGINHHRHGTIPIKEAVVAFLTVYLVGKTVAEMAQELGVQMELVSRSYGRVDSSSSPVHPVGLAPSKRIINVRNGDTKLWRNYRTVGDN